MIRLSEAHAKMRLSTEVTANDVHEAVRLIKSALKEAATDRRTGLIDMGLLTEGVSAGERRRKDDLKGAVLALVDEMTGAGGSARVAELVRRLSEQQAQDGSGGQVEGQEVTEALRALEAEGRLAVSGDGARRSVRRVTGVI